MTLGSLGASDEGIDDAARPIAAGRHGEALAEEEATGRSAPSTASRRARPSVARACIPARVGAREAQAPTRAAE
jgi:hypothetical protein